MNKQTKNLMETIIVVRDIVSATPYWVMDETLPEARNRFKRLTGRFPSSKASIIAFTGKSVDIDTVTIDSMGDISFSKNLTKAVIQ